MISVLSLTCSMRRAIAYPCSEPIASSVLRTIRSSVPCRTSDLLSPIVSPCCCSTYSVHRTQVECQHITFLPGGTWGGQLNPFEHGHGAMDALLIHVALRGMRRVRAS